MSEKIIHYGENKRGFGIITLPVEDKNSPIVVLLNAGMLHRSEPYGLNTKVARKLAELGCICVRVDLSGKGDTPAREDIDNRESVWKDWKAISTLLNQQFGRRSLVIFGLCSGADNGIKIAAQDDQVMGLILLDPVAKRDSGFARRQLLGKARNKFKWLGLPKTFYLKFTRLLSKTSDETDTISLRDEPTEEDIDKCYKRLVKQNGCVLTVFTNHEIGNYNMQGQYCQALNIEGFSEICEEVFWPHASHLYPVAQHREQLVLLVSEWARKHLNALRSSG